jgi:3-hydroxyacyl-CoA dehydrogenase
MRLLEIVQGPKTRSEAAAAIADFADRRLGKSVVMCKDTPGFIANRIGSYWMQGRSPPVEMGVPVEEADRSRPSARRPKTGYSPPIWSARSSAARRRACVPCRKRCSRVDGNGP